MKDKLIKFLGIEQYHTGHSEKLVSALGSFLGIYLVFYTSTYFLQGSSAYLVVASMGASAVLLFAVPHGPLSQPWSLIGGHLVSALIGVTCAKFIPDVFIAAPLAVGVAVAAMYYLHCIHPPGGATALSAVVGGSSVHALGYQFVLTPILINVMAIFFVAITFNYLFKWRRYPVYLARINEKQTPDNSYGSITHEDFVYALSEFESYIDISEDDLLKIYGLVTHRHHMSVMQFQNLQNGHYYSNGEHGKLWAVRQIVDWAEPTTPNESKVEDDGEDIGEGKLIYKIIAGEDRRSSAVVTKNEFSRWAKYEVERDEGNWRRIDHSD